MMKIQVNGKPYELSGETITELLEALNAPPRGIAVECNGIIIPKSDHATYALKPQDEVEIIGFIGGG